MSGSQVLIPAWDQADRLRKALREADLGVQDMADYLGVSRNTIGRYLSGAAPAKIQTLRLWAMRCGVSYEWLRTGVSEVKPDGDPGGVASYRCTLPRATSVPIRPIGDAGDHADHYPQVRAA